MIFRHALLVGLISGLAATAYAQTPPPAPATPPAATATTKPMAGPQAADAKKLIGRNVKNPQDETVGEIESVYINADGKVDSVIVGVGGFLGVGERLVRVAWKDLQISQNGERVMVNATKDQLKGMSPYTYRDPKWKGQVYNDSGVWVAERNPPAGQTASAAITESTGDFNAQGAVSGNAYIGAKVRNAAKETVGSVEDVYIDGKGAIQAVIVSVGGFLGVGTKNVAVKFSDVKVTRDGNSLVLTTDWTKDTLKNMPDYKWQRRQPVRSGG